MRNYYLYKCDGCILINNYNKNDLKTIVMYKLI